MDSKKIITFYLLVTFLLRHAAHASVATNHILLKLEKKPSLGACPSLVASFLKEFRDIESDSEITLDSGSKAPTTPELETYTVNCDDGAHSISLKSAASEHPFTFRYVERSQEFDASDWLTFQKRNRLNLSDLRGEATHAYSGLSPHDKAEQTTEQVSFYKKGWFWAVTGGVLTLGVTAFLINQNQQGGSAQVGLK